MILALCFQLSTTAQGQITADPPSNFQVFMLVVGNQSVSIFDTTAFDVSNQTVKAKLVVSVTDATNIAKIHVKMGSTVGGSDLVNHVFTTDPLQIVPQDYSFEFFNNKYNLVIGQYTGLTTYHCEVKLEYTDGQISSPVTYSSE